MMQEDSNGESTFEFVEGKLDELSMSDEAVSKAGSTQSIPSLSGASTLTIISSDSSFTSLSSSTAPSISPPAPLPSFVQEIRTPEPSKIPPASNLVFPIPPVKTITAEAPIVRPPTITPAVMPQPIVSPLPTAEHGASTRDKSSVDRPVLQEPESSGGLFGWMKGAVGSNGIIAKVAEKAKNSVDSVITTLDPQMKEFLHSGGDIDIVVASDKEVKISPIREAFQSVFGRATVHGLNVQPVVTAAQPVGIAAGVKAAEERIQLLRESGKLHEKQPIVALENFIFEASEDRWYDLGVLILSDPGNRLNLQAFTQPTPVPPTAIAQAQQETPADYPLRWSGLAVTIGSVMGRTLQVPHNAWHETFTGVSRREMILMATRVLASLYKNALANVR